MNDFFKTTSQNKTKRLLCRKELVLPRPSSALQSYKFSQK